MNDDLPYNNLTNMYQENISSNSDMDVEPNNNNRSNNNNENSFNSIKVGLIDSRDIESPTGMIQEKMNKITQIQRKRRGAYLGKTVEDLFIKLHTPLLSEENVKDFLSKFLRSDIIGKGSYGEVRVVNIEDSFYVVKRIKFLKKHHQLENNINILNNPSLVDSPYLIKTFGYVRKGEHSYSIMEYLDGQSWMNLEDYMNQNMNTSHICSKLKDGLTKIHELNFFHQDIKPANIMIHTKTTPLQIKFIDYGFSIINPSTSLSSGTGHSALYGCPVPIGNTYLDQIKNVDIFAVKIICILLKKKLYKNVFNIIDTTIKNSYKEVKFLYFYKNFYLILLEITCDKNFSSENVYNLYSMFVGNKTPKKGKWNNLEVPNPSSFLKFKYINHFLKNSENSEYLKNDINFLCSLLHRQFIIDFATEFENTDILTSFYNQYINIS